MSATDLLRSLKSGGSSADVLVVSHSGDRAGAPMMLLHFLRWLERETHVDAEVVLLHGGHMETTFSEEFGARVLGASSSRLWMVERGLHNLGVKKAANALAYARVGPTMWSYRSAPLVLLNSVGSLPALRFLPRSATRKNVLYIHELDQSFERTIGDSAWQLLSPKVDHFISCADVVTDMLERRGVPSDRISRHYGFIAEPHVDRLRVDHLRSEMGIPPDAFVVGGMGRPDWRKAPEVFARVASAITHLRPDLPIHYVWIGGPIDSSPGWQLTHDFASLGIPSRFHLTGEIEDAVDVVGSLDAFALTSREDAFPLAVLEASALGVPVVSFDNGGITEFARAGGREPLATVVPYLDVQAMADGILALFTEPGRADTIATRARDHVLSNHLIEHGAPALFDTLASLVPSLDGPRRADVLTLPTNPSVSVTDHESVPNPASCE